MSHADVTLIQSLYAAFGRGDIATIVAAMAPDVSWTVTGRRSDYPALGTWKGPQQVQDFFRIVGETEEAIDFSPQEFHAVDGKVFVTGHYAWKLRKTGRTVSSDWIHIFTLRGGKVTQFREFNDTAQFAEAYRG